MTSTGVEFISGDSFRLPEFPSVHPIELRETRVLHSDHQSPQEATLGYAAGDLTLSSSGDDVDKEKTTPKVSSRVFL